MDYQAALEHMGWEQGLAVLTEKQLCRLLPLAQSLAHKIQAELGVRCNCEGPCDANNFHGYVCSACIETKIAALEFQGLPIPADPSSIR